MAEPPESAVRVLAILTTQGPMTCVGITTESEMPTRTVRYALRWLRKMGRIADRRSLIDSRKIYYGLPDDLPGANSIRQRPGF